MLIEKPRKINAIQGLRGVAALAVILYHVGRHIRQVIGETPISYLTQSGNTGVDLFFVLSGFIIFHVHRGDIGRPEALGRYARQRFTRLMPIYWMALTATILLMLPRHAEKVTAAKVMLSTFLLGGAEDMLLNVAWSLQHELLFYVAFALLIFSRKLGVISLLLWFSWGLLQQIGLVTADTAPRFSSLYNLQFLFGMVAALVVNGKYIRHPIILTLIGIASFAIAAIFQTVGMMEPLGDVARLAFGLASALLITGLASLPPAIDVKTPKFMVEMGEASYTIYLFHLMGIGFAWQIWSRIGMDTASYPLTCFFVLAIAGLAMGLLTHHKVEKPLLQMMRAKKKDNPKLVAEG